MNSLQDYKYLISVADTLHFGKAAELCHISQPTLSGQIKKMESLIGFKIFERSNRKVTITRKGLPMISEARKVVEAQKSFKQKSKELLSPYSGELHFGLIPTLAPYLLPHIMPQLNMKLPKMNFYLYEQETEVLLSQLNKGKLDALILPYLPEMQTFTKIKLFDEPLVLALPSKHPLAKKQSLLLSDLKGQQVLTLKDGHCLREQTLGYCFIAGAKEDASFSATSLETLRHMISAGAGITLMPELATFNREDKGMLYRKFSSEIPSREIVLLTRSTYSNTVSVTQVSEIITHIIADKLL